MKTPKWGEALGYEWTVGHRLKRSRKILAIEAAKEYYAELRARGLKTAFAHENIPLSALLTMTLRRRAKDIKETLLAGDSRLVALKKHGAIKTRGDQ